MAINKLTDDEIKTLMEQINDEKVYSDDAVDYIISFDENFQESRYTSEPRQELLHENPFVLDDRRAVKTFLRETARLISQKRKVCSIDTALNPENCKAFRLPDTEGAYKVIISKKTKYEPEKTLIRSTNPPALPIL